MRSKKVWLYKDGNPYLQMAPSPKEFTKLDSERELIEYTIEFIINRNYDEETYTL